MASENSQKINDEDSPSVEPPNPLKPIQPTETKVKVVVRVRPFISKEIINNELTCVQCFKDTSQVLMGKDKSFTFEKVFDTDSQQQEVYEDCGKELVMSCLSGYNATILAYGQTGSGKTYTMGSNTAYDIRGNETGMIPRVMKELFNEIEKRKSKSEYILRVSFLEIYNEEIQDLLDASAARFRLNPAFMNKNPITIREEKDGSISVYGAKEEKVTSYEEMIAFLEKGSLQRSTASTLMNETSSRSHAIFTISLEQHKIDDLYKKNPKAKPSPGDTSFTMAKFHFVDLAGSERLKKTGASGTILREGININRGLLALGNVISALTDLSGKISHVPYRESKLTRILQDSLGGNSRTVMIACISPAESNFDESLNTLKYASRARNIKNKPIINTDPQSSLVSQLRQQVFDLQAQLLGYKKILATTAKEQLSLDPQALANLIPGIGSSGVQTKNEEVDLLNEEIKSLKITLIKYEKELAIVNTDLQQTKLSLNQSEISVYTLQKERDLFKLMSEKYQKVLEENNLPISNDSFELEGVKSETLIEEYSKTIEKLKQELKDKEKFNEELHKEYEALMKSSVHDQELLLEKTKIIQSLTSELKRKEKLSLNLESLKKNQIPTIMSVTERTDTCASEIKDTEGDQDEIHEEDERLEREFEMNSELRRKEMLLVDGTLNEKEELLRNMTQNQLALEKSLKEEMKNQYYKKAYQVENEVKLLEKQRDEALNKAGSTQHESDKIISTYKQKISELENKAKEFKKREKEQQTLLKLVESQRQKIQQLDEEIKKVKLQKIQLYKKMKEDADKFEKWKSVRQKELLEAKKINVEKDLVISKLKTENKKKDFMYKKKAEELLAKYMSKELLGQIQSETQKALAPSTNAKRRKNLSSQLTPGDIDGLSFDEGSMGALNEEDAKQLIDYCTVRLLDNLKISYKIEKEETGMKKTEEELDLEKNKYAELVLKRDKLEVERRHSLADLDQEQEYSIKLEEYNLELNDISSHVESLETKLEFQLNKMNELADELAKKPKVSPEQILLHNERILKNSGNMKLVLRCLFGKYVATHLDIVKLNEKIGQNTLDIAEMRKRMEEAEQKAKLNELQYEISLTKLTREYEKNQYFLMKGNNDEDDEDQEVEGYDSMLDTSKTQTNTSFQSPKGLKSIFGQEEKLSRSHYDFMTPTQKPNLKPNSGARRNSALLPESPFKKSSIANGASHTASASKAKPGESLAEQNKRLEKMVAELTKKQLDNEKAIDNWRRKCELLQTKYDQLKKGSGTERYYMGKINNDDASLRMTPMGSSAILATDRSQYNTTPSMMNLSYLGSGGATTARKVDDNESFSKQKNDKSEFKILSLASLREKRKEEKEKEKTKPAAAEVVTSKTGSEGKIHDRARAVTTIDITKTMSDKQNPKSQDLKSKKTVVNNKKQSFLKKRATASSENDISSRKMSGQFDSTEAQLVIDTEIRDSSNEREELKTSFDEEPPLEETSSWKCHANIEGAHFGPVYCVTSLGNMLYSAGHKTFKVWSLDAISCISEIVAHSSSIRSIAICQEKNLLATACDKSIMLWDLISLQNVGTLKGHKDEIRALAVCDGLLLSGGKGSPTSGALFVWDLRTLSLLEEKEKDQEIKSMVAHNKILYYGNQGHRIRSVNLETMKSLSPFDPPHKDTISSLAIIKDQLVSASKDSTLKLWNLNHHILNLKHTVTSSKDFMNVVESNLAQDILYSGSKSGIVKIWNVAEEKLNCIGSFTGHNQSVNSICKLYDEHETMFATASSDRNIKIWKPVEEEDFDIIQKYDNLITKSENPSSAGSKESPHVIQDTI